MQLSKKKGNGGDSVILGVDIGTTNIRCYAYDQLSNVVGKAVEKLDIINPGDGRHEIVPNVLWESFQKVVKNCLIASHVQANEVTCMGISTQRGTFLTWDRETGKPFHNFISWKDRRADDICDQWNSSYLVKLLRFSCFLSYVLTRKTKFQVFSALRFSSAMVLMRLLWILEHFTEIRQRGYRNQVLFGTIDTWLVWNLTGGKVHATDGSNACVTGFFDPFKIKWIDWLLSYCNIPKQILPIVKDTCDSFGETVPNIFGSSIPICCVVGDQQASTFGAGCFKMYDVNCTMGTGTFLSVVTGSKPFASRHGVLPLIGWTIRSKATYVAECGFHETGPFVLWMQNLGFFEEPSECSSMAQNVSDSGGVYFLPAHNLLKNSKTGNYASMFVGLQTTTSKEQIVRSVLESLAFQVCLLFNAISKLCGTEKKLKTIRMCGGVAKNDFVLQVVSNITSTSIHRLRHSETSSLGAAFLAGLHFGVWHTLDELTECQKNYDEFTSKPAALGQKSSKLAPLGHKSFSEWENVLKHKLCTEV